MLRLGYACINLTLEASTNHTVRLATARHPDRVRAAVQRNLDDLARILPWNAEHGYALFRLGQGLIPFASHPVFPYDWQAEHGDRLRQLGAEARRLGQRLSMHPGQYVNPASPDPDVRDRSLAELRYSAAVLDLIGGDDSNLVLHLGGAYGDKRETMARFVEVLRDEPAVQRYLVLEHDEHQWTAEEVIEAATRLGVPAVIDNLHHRLNPGELTLAEAIDRAWTTWEASRPGQRPKLHLSSQDPAKPAGSHAWAIDPADWAQLRDAIGDRDADVMIEAKGKEQALPAAVR